MYCACIVVRSSLVPINFFSPYFSSLDYVLAMYTIVEALQLLFSFDLVILLITIDLFTLIVSNWILFSISSLVV